MSCSSTAPRRFTGPVTRGTGVWCPLREVIIEDSLGIGAELEAEMAHIVATYRCEWKATVEDPVKLHRFRTFVNSEASDPNVVSIRLRAQHRPATWEEKARLSQQGVG